MSILPTFLVPPVLFCSLSLYVFPLFAVLFCAVLSCALFCFGVVLKCIHLDAAFNDRRQPGSEGEREESVPSPSLPYGTHVPRRVPGEHDQCSAVQCNSVQRIAMQSIAIQCIAIQCNAIQCSAMQLLPSSLLSFFGPSVRHICHCQYSTTASFVLSSLSSLLPYIFSGRYLYLLI